MEEKNEETPSVIQRILRRKKLVIVVIVLIVGGYFGYQKYFGNGSDLEEATIQRGVVAEELILSGEIKADEHANLLFSTSGKINWIGVEEGDEVKKGQALAKLDTQKLNSDLQRARSDLRDTEATVLRVHDDVKDNDEDESFTEKETRTAAEVAKDKAYEAVLKAEEDLRNATLYAPFAGVITAITNPYSGVNVIFSQSQIEIVNPETIYFEVTAEQTEVTRLRLGQKVNLNMDSFADKEFEGEVSFISYAPDVGEVGTVYRVKITLTSEVDPQDFRVGMTGDAKFILAEKSDVLYVPSRFVNSDTEGKFVYKERSNNKVYVEVGLEGEEVVEISGDIKEGDTIYD